MTPELYLYRATYQRLGTEARMTFAERNLDAADAFMQRMCSVMHRRRQPAKVISIECLRPIAKQLELT